jgi:hypothetical protein
MLRDRREKRSRIVEANCDVPRYEARLEDEDYWRWALFSEAGSRHASGFASKKTPHRAEAMGCVGRLIRLGDD